MLMHYAIDENSTHGLKDLGVRFCGVDRYEEDINKWKRKNNHTDKPY